MTPEAGKELEELATTWWLANYSRYEHQPDKDQDIAGLQGFKAGFLARNRMLEKIANKQKKSHSCRLLAHESAWRVLIDEIKQFGEEE